MYTLTPLLLDINLQQVPDTLLTGTWRVVDRTLNRADPASLLAQVTHVHLQAGSLVLEATDRLSVTGEWHVERDALLSRPYILFQFAIEQVRALITRLRHSLDNEHRMLVLYFQSGLELFLVQP